MPHSEKVRARAVALAGGYAAAGLALAATQSISNGDTFGHLAQGRVIAEYGGPPPLDPFSFFRPEPQPWPNYEWLSDVLTWAVYSVGGWNALIFVSAALVACAGVALVLLAARSSERAAWLTSLLLVAAIPATRFRMSARPHLLTLPFSALYLHVLIDPRAFATRRRTVQTLAGLALAQVLWANLHGSHLLGIVLVGAAALASWPDRARMTTLAGAALLLMLASCVTPFGAALTRDAIAHVFDPDFRRVVTEWHDISSGSTWTITYACVVALGLVMAGPLAWRGGWERRTAWLVAAILIVGALRSLRFVLDGVLFAAPVLAMALADVTQPGVERGVARITRGGGLALAASAVAVLAWLGAARVDALVPIGIGLDTRFVPAEAVAHLETIHPRARVLGSMPTGWYTLFAAPEARVLIDGRAPFYGTEHVSEMSLALDQEGHLLAALRRFDVDTVIVQHTAPDEHGALVDIGASRDFVRTWVDASYAVYVRRDRVDASRYAALEALPSSYDPGPILGADDANDIRRGLAMLGDGPDGRALAAFVRAMLRMRPLAREGGWAGFRAPTSPAEVDAVALARREIELTRGRVGPIPAVLVQAMLITVASCELDAARALLALAQAEGDTRETLFGAAEIDLRAGDLGRVRAFLDAARTMPEAATDPWVMALDAMLADPPRCE